LAWKEEGSTQSTKALRNWGLALAQQHDFEGGIPKIRDALTINPDEERSYTAYNSLARALVEADRFEEAEQCWAEAVAIGEKAQSPQRVVALRSWGEARVARKDYDGARQKIRDALTIDPTYGYGSYTAYNSLARALVEADRFEEAEQCWAEAVAIGEKAQSPQRALTLRGWGEALLARHRIDEALDKQLLALGIDPDDSADPFSLLARAYAQTGQFSEAAGVISKAVVQMREAADWSRTRALTAWGWTLKSLQLLDEAAGLFRQGLEITADNPELYRGLGLVLADQGQFENALQQYRKSSDIYQKQRSDNLRYALINSALALQELERFDEAIEKARQATEAEPTDVWVLFDYAGVLAASDRLDDALAVLNTAIARESERHDEYPHAHPYLRHNRAHYLFALGRYKESWTEWRNAYDAYERIIPTLSDSEKAEEKAAVAANFGTILSSLFYEFEAAEKYFKLSISLIGYDDVAWRGLASTYQKWSDADRPPSDIQVRLTRAIQQAISLSKRRLWKGNDLPILLALADMHIETQDWIAAEACLARASSICPDSRRKRSEIDARRGLLDFRSDRFAAAVENLRKAARVQPGDLEWRANLGKALLRAKRLSEARDEFARILKSAPAQVDALVGAGQVCIELAEEGETEYYEQAEQRLSEALRHGRNAETGSIRLIGNRLDEVYYLRGYARSKRWECEGASAALVTLYSAKRDFSQCLRHPQATAAKKKISAYLRRRVREVLQAWLGLGVMFVFAAAVFTFVQLNFFFHDQPLSRWLSPVRNLEDPVTYASLTFGSLFFMAVALYLPHVLKLKVPGLELEKSAAQVSAPSSLGISLSSSSQSS
jgi:pentatricopeptide repeat protein